MRRLLTILIAVSATIALMAGCSSSKPSKSSDEAGSAPDAATLVKEASAATGDLKSVHLVLAVAGKIEKMPVKMLEGDLTTQPSTAAKGSATITMAGSDIDVKFVVIDGDLYGAISGDDWADFGRAADIYDVAAILSRDNGLANVLANFNDPEVDGQERVNGQDTVRITGSVPADAVNKLAPQLGATDSMPGTVWIQKDGDHELVQARLDQSPNNSIQMTLSNWNAPVTVEKPAGA